VQMAKLAAMLSSGVSLKHALEEVNFSEIPKPLRLGMDLGAPLVPLLRSLDSQSQNQVKARGELGQALAVPNSTRRLLLWLPFFTLALTFATGIIQVEALINPLVLAGFLLGTVMLVIGSRISKRMLGGFRNEFDVSALQDFQLALSAGLNASEISSLFPNLLEDPNVAALIHLSRRTGARLIGLTESQIELELSTQLAGKVTELRELSVKLLIPLGLTTLPAFMLFIIPPVLVGLSK